LAGERVRVWERERGVANCLYLPLPLPVVCYCFVLVAGDVCYGKIGFGGVAMSVRVEVVKILERHKLESKGKPIWLVHSLVRIKSDGEDYVRLFVPTSVVLQEGKEYPVLFNGVALRVKEEEFMGWGFSYETKFPKPSELP
jgi:hypothetical protein